ncbi:chorismate synthase [Candidatus Gottesmanbacteria bacterium RIFCSPHIGHO2_02_FULL_40_13]|uniref:Chorismate synthase n=1 Tax=Candidatus Gottesmanbacteria bacterium RIFCSPHIGHO2_02_FULL_40_13 TaxID=1798384 RepID=A0A1F6A7Z5_9BACT|nr:MAG: chorismate synthase [Candidatus Gottesmanbacteria bacterium RIFCSPHIGHO2_02_FULL_40_13]
MIRFLTAGESHGPAEVAILEGIPAGLSLVHHDIQKELEKRKSGAGRGGRGKIESDTVKILSGVRNGKTLGSPIALLVDNMDHDNWNEKMSIEPLTSEGVKLKHLTNPRPGHADLAGVIKYHFDDVRSVLERASARETVMRVAVGAICKKLLAEFKMLIASHTVQIGKVILEAEERDFHKIVSVDQTDPDIRCIEMNTSKRMKQAIIDATMSKDTLGGVIEVIASRVPAGLGSYVHYDRKLDGLIAGALMSIPSVKAVEIGTGVANASDLGSDVHDEIISDGHNIRRKTNRAGGLEGGVTNGENVVVRVYHKPLSSLGSPLNTIDLKTKKAAKALLERSDICVIPRAGVISEAMLSFVLANSFLEKFGGDSMAEINGNYLSYLGNLRNL